MNNNRNLYLFTALLSFLGSVAVIFFALTDSKSALAFWIIAVFFVLNGVFWIYRSVKEKRAL